MLNIPPSLTDTCWAYRMPAPRVKYFSDSKTCLENIDNVSYYLRTPFEYIMKFMGFEFSCHVNFKDHVFFRYIGEKEILKALDKFIRDYILCRKCHYPEVKLKFDEKKHSIVQACNACGANTKRPNGSKIDAYILKDLIKKQNGDEKKLSKVEFVEERKIEEPQQSFNSIEKSVEIKIKRHYSRYKKYKQDDATYAELFDSVHRDVPYQHWNKIPYLLFNEMFDINIIKEINQNEVLLKKIYNDFGVRDPQFDLLLSLEKFVYVKINNGDFEKYIPTMLKMFYDLDLLEEDLIRDWDQGKLKSRFLMDFRYESGLDEKFKKAAEPFIEWIKNTDEEE